MANNLGTPKATAFFLALLPTVVDMRVLTLADSLVLGLTVAVCATAVLWASALAVARARWVFTAPRAVRLMNRGSSVAMAAAADAARYRCGCPGVRHFEGSASSSGMACDNAPRWLQSATCEVTGTGIARRRTPLQPAKLFRYRR